MHFYRGKKLPKVNNHPRGENSPNLVTLTRTAISRNGMAAQTHTKEKNNSFTPFEKKNALAPLHALP
jgi:hypothetical protein